MKKKIYIFILIFFSKKKIRVNHTHTHQPKHRTDYFFKKNMTTIISIPHTGGDYDNNNNVEASDSNVVVVSVPHDGMEEITEDNNNNHKVWGSQSCFLVDEMKWANYGHHPSRRHYNYCPSIGRTKYRGRVFSCSAIGITMFISMWCIMSLAFQLNRDDYRDDDRDEDEKHTTTIIALGFIIRCAHGCSFFWNLVNATCLHNDDRYYGSGSDDKSSQIRDWCCYVAVSFTWQLLMVFSCFSSARDDMPYTIIIVLTTIFYFYAILGFRHIILIDCAERTEALFTQLSILVVLKFVTVVLLGNYPYMIMNGCWLLAILFRISDKPDYSFRRSNIFNHLDLFHVFYLMIQIGGICADMYNQIVLSAR